MLRRHLQLLRLLIKRLLIMKPEAANIFWVQQYAETEVPYCYPKTDSSQSKTCKTYNAMSQLKHIVC